MADHQTTIRLTIEGDDKDLKNIAAQIENLTKENPLVKKIKVETDDLEKVKKDFDGIDKTKFEKLSQNFKAVSDQLKSDANITATVAVSELSKITNDPAFENLSVRFKSAVDSIKQEANITATISQAELHKINDIRFDRLNVDFKSATQQMQTDAKSASDSIAQEFNNLSGALSGALAGMGGALAADKIFQEANSRAATIWRLNNRYGTEANRIMKEFVNYDIASARPDHDLIQMFEWLSNSGELASVDVNRAMSIFDAVSASGDPLRQRGKQMAYGRYLSSGYEASKMMFRDEGLSDAQLDKLKQANTLEERLNALREIGLEQGAIQIGQNGEIIGQYNTLEGDLGGYNELLSLIDVLVQGATLAFMDLMNVLRPVISTIKDFASANQGLVGGLIIGAIAIAGIGGAAMAAVSVITSFIGTFKSFLNITNVLGKSGGLGGAPGGGFLQWIKNFNKFAIETAANAATSIPSLSAMAAGIQAMLAPLLMVSAVVAVMVVVIAAIAAEIILFVRGLGELIKALRFDKLNLGPSIEGIKQIGSAMWEILKAFTVLTTINIVNVIYTATGGIIGTSLALGQFWLAIKEIEIVLKDINKLEIDENSVVKINQIKDVLNSISGAMLSMASINLSGLANFITGGFLNTFMNIKILEDIAKIINDLKIPNIDSKKAEQIAKLSEIIKKITEASEAVSNNWSKFQITTDMEKPIKDAIDTLYGINQHLNTKPFYVDPSKTEQVKNLKEVITNLVDVSKTVSDNWSKFQITVDMATPIKDAITTLYSINQKLNETAFNVDPSKIESISNLKNIITNLSDISTVVSDNWSKFQITVDMATPIKDAITTLYSINQHLNSKPFEVTESIVTGINNLKTVLTAIKDIIVFINDNIEGIESISDKEADIKGAISSLYSINQHINSMPFQVDEAKTKVINSLKTTIQAIINTLKAAAGVEAAASNMGGQIVKGFKTGVNPLSQAAVTEVAGVISEIQKRYQTAFNAGSALGKKLVDGFRAGLNQKSPGDAAKAAALEAEFIASAFENNKQTLYNIGRDLYMEAASGFGGGINRGSPGDIANMMKSEVNYTIDALKEGLSVLYNNARILGQSIVAGFGSIELGINEMLKNITLDPLTVKLVWDDSVLQPIGLDLSNIELQQQKLMNEVKQEIMTDLKQNSSVTGGGESNNNPQIVENHYHHHYHSPLIERRASDLIIETMKAEKEREESRQ